MRDKVLMFLSIVLLVVVGFQGYYLYKVNKKLDEKESYYQPVKKVIPKISTNGIAPLNKTVNSNNSADPFREFALASNLNPFKEFQKMQEEMDRMFGSFNAKFQNDPDFDKLFQDFTVSPSLDMKDLGDKYIININIPGSKENNIKISVKNHTLKVEATTKKVDDKKGSHYIQKERFVGKFEREITLPGDADENALKSRYINGVLVITIPKNKSLSKK